MNRTRLQLIPLNPAHVRVLLREGSEAFTAASGMEIAEGIRDFFFMAPEAYRVSLEQATAADVWAYGFAAVLSEPRLWIGSAGYKGAPDSAGMVEIAYGVAPEFEGRGHATEIAAGLVDYAFGQAQVRLARAHSLPERNASCRVLEKCGFQFVGAVTDPEDGLVWRWEKPKV